MKKYQARHFKGFDVGSAKISLAFCPQNVKDYVSLLEKTVERLDQRSSEKELLAELYRDANPSLLEDADTGVRLSPYWNERIKAILKDEK